MASWIGAKHALGFHLSRTVFYSGPGNRARALSFAECAGATLIDLPAGGGAMCPSPLAPRGARGTKGGVSVCQYVGASRRHGGFGFKSSSAWSAGSAGCRLQVESCGCGLKFSAPLRLCGRKFFFFVVRFFDAPLPVPLPTRASRGEGRKRGSKAAATPARGCQCRLAGGRVSDASLPCQGHQHFRVISCFAGTNLRLAASQPTALRARRPALRILPDRGRLPARIAAAQDGPRPQ